MMCCQSHRLSSLPAVWLAGETNDPGIVALRNRQMKNFHLALMLSQVLDFSCLCFFLPMIFPAYDFSCLRAQT